VICSLCRRPRSKLDLHDGRHSRGRQGVSEPLPAAETHLSRRTTLTLFPHSFSAEEPVAAVGFEPRHAHSGRHLEPLQGLSRSVFILEKAGTDAERQPCPADQIDSGRDLGEMRGIAITDRRAQGGETDAARDGGQRRQDRLAF
jgi:hypothetical protein